MKKILIFITVILFTQFKVTSAQTHLSDYFEGGKIDESFTIAMKRYGTTNIEGKVISYEDFPKGSELFVAHQTISQGLALATILIQGPSLMKLKKTTPNVIITDRAIIIIQWYEKTWILYLVDSSVIAHAGARVFTLSDKN